MSIPDQRQAEWDEHVSAALDVARTASTGQDRIPQDDEGIAGAVAEITGTAAVIAAGHRAWDQRTAGNGETGEAA